MESGESLCRKCVIRGSEDDDPTKKNPRDDREDICSARTAEITFQKWFQRPGPVQTSDNNR